MNPSKKGYEYYPLISNEMALSAKDGDPSAREEVGSLIFRHAKLRIVDNLKNVDLETIEDMASKVVELALLRLPTFTVRRDQNGKDVEDGFSRLLNIIISGVIKDFFKSKKDLISLDDLSPNFTVRDLLFTSENEHESTDVPEITITANELATILKKAVKELTQEQQKVVILHYVYGLKFREIAEIVDSNENAVKTLHNRAKKSLRRNLLRGDSGIREYLVGTSFFREE